MWRLVLFLFCIAPRCSGLQQLQVQPACHSALQLALPEARLLENSSLLANGLIYKTGTFWLDNATDTYLGCPCNVTRCIRMCAAGSSANSPANAALQLTVWHDDSWLNVTVAEHFTVVSGATCPRRQGLLEPHREIDDQYAILSNGSLYYTTKKVVEHAEHFCLRVNNTGEQQVEVVICMPPLEPVKRYPPLQMYLYPVLLMISVIFLMLTLAVYLLAPEARNMHGRCLSVHCGCLLIAFLGLFVNRLAGEKAKLPLCYTIALVTYYFLMASFFWLNVMSFDIWQTFRKVSSCRGRQPRKKFTQYCLYASLMPTILFIITLSVHLAAPRSLSDSMVIKTCWFQSRPASFIYFHAPVSLLLISNLYFFLATAVSIYKSEKEASVLKVGDSRTHGSCELDKHRYKVYIKLSLIMGVSWISEIFSWVLEGRSSYWYFTDIINLLQGFWIFLLCVWTTKNREIFLQRILPSRLSQIFTVHTEVTTV